MTTTTEPRGAITAPAGLDVDAAYVALAARDRRFDGRIWFGVTSTGVYCRPVCPAQTPKAANVRFFASPAAAVSSGFRACRRCRPDSAPGSRHWDHRGDLTARALRLISDGAVDDGGVAGLARTLHVSERHLHRTLVAEVGAGPLHLAVSRRAQTARLLIEQTSLPLAGVAFAAGFSSIRQFNDVMRREFGLPPSALRRSPSAPLAAADPSLVLRLRLRPPYDADAVGEFLAARAVEGLEVHEATRRGWTHRRVVPLPVRAAVVGIEVAGDHVVVRSDADLRDTAALVHRVRRWLDLDAEPATIAAALSTDAALAPLVADRPGLRVPTTVDAWETVRARGRRPAGVGRGRPHPARTHRARRRQQRRRRPAGVPDGVGGGRGRCRRDRGDRDAGRASALAARRRDRGLRRLDRPALGRPRRGRRGPPRRARHRTVDRVLRPAPRARRPRRPARDRPRHPARRGRARTARTPRALSPSARREWSPWRSYAAQHLWTRPEEKS